MLRILKVIQLILRCFGYPQLKQIVHPHPVTTFFSPSEDLKLERPEGWKVMMHSPTTVTEHTASSTRGDTQILNEWNIHQFNPIITLI